MIGGILTGILAPTSSYVDNYPGSEFTYRKYVWITALWGLGREMLRRQEAAGRCWVCWKSHALSWYLKGQSPDVSFTCDLCPRRVGVGAN